MEQRQAFFDALFARCTDYRDTALTLTAILPDGKHSTPSRHIPLNDPAAMQDAFARLDAANAMGWGAYFAVGLRRSGLTRWQRGGAADVIALPALFVDVDDPSLNALTRLQCADPAPSCITFSGGGYHAYWWLDHPTTDLQMARQGLRGLAAALHGDSLSIAQSLRVPLSRNTKPSRGNALCEVLELHERRYPLEVFTAYLPRTAVMQRKPSARPPQTPFMPNANLVGRITDALTACGCKRRGDWLNGACPFPERHKHGDRHPSFGFNTRTGYGFCHVCGTLLLKDLCAAFDIPQFSERR
jgi:hypothetical protein